MKNQNQYLKVLGVAIITITVFACVFYAFSYRRVSKINPNTFAGETPQVTPSSSSDINPPEKSHFIITCPTGTTAYDRDDGRVCSDSPDGMWNGSVEVATTTAHDVQEVVSTNNQKLALTDSAYMQVVRETSIDGESAIIVKQTYGSEAGPQSDTLAKTLLVIHEGYLYSVHTREYQKDVDTFFSSFHFSK
jgi:hypothetical protein